MLQFRHAILRDAPALAEIWMRSMEEKIYKVKLTEPDRGRYRKEEQDNLQLAIPHKKNMNTAHPNILIASIDSNPLGYLVYDVKGHTCRIDDLYVARDDTEEASKIKIGQALIKKAIGLKQGLTSIRTTVMTESIQFYRKMGFEIVSPEDGGRKDKYLCDMQIKKNNIDAWHMTALPAQKRPSFTQPS